MRRGGCWEKVWEIWVKRTLRGRVGWDAVWAGAGVGGDHPHHMFHGVLQCGWLWAKHTQHTQPHALPDALIFPALPPQQPGKTSTTCPYRHHKHTHARTHARTHTAALILVHSYKKFERGRQVNLFFLFSFFFFFFTPLHFMMACQSDKWLLCDVTALPASDYGSLLFNCVKTRRGEQKAKSINVQHFSCFRNLVTYRECVRGNISESGQSHS